MILAIFRTTCEGSLSNATDLLTHTDELSIKDRDLLSVYHQSWDDDKVDVELILTLLHSIHTTKDPGKHI